MNKQGILSQHQSLLDAGRFLIQHCAGCGKHIYFPREICPHCGSDDLSLVAPAGTGTVYATTTVRRKADAGGDYNVALVDLDEGVRLMSHVVNDVNDVQGVPPSRIQIGLRVKARVQVTDGRGLVVFDPLEALA